MDTVDMIIEYEMGNLDLAGTMKLFSELIKTGQCWTLQGSYGRAAKSLIEQGFMDGAGKVDWDRVNAICQKY